MRSARAFATVEGLSIVKLPYGVLSAIDLARGELKWQVPHGDTLDIVRNHPKLKGMNIPKTGQGGSVGVLVTKTLVIAADPQVTTTPAHPRGAMMRAYDKETGKEVGAVWMPAPVSGSPMTYALDGRQYYRDRRQRRQLLRRVPRVPPARMKAGTRLLAIVALAVAAVSRPSLGALQAPPLQAQPPATAPPAQADSVWAGVYTEEQATRGEAVYLQTCASCHGLDLEGGDMTTALTGATFSSNWNDLSLGDLFERIRISMPMDNPGTLSRQQNADVIAYILKANNWPAGGTELARQLMVLRQIKIEAVAPGGGQ